MTQERTDCGGWLGETLRQAWHSTDTPGAAIGVLVNGAIYCDAAGVLDLDTGAVATADACFQVGSIGKLFTAALTMQHVDAGRIALDTPLRAAVPEFALADPPAAACISLRHLLAHSSGIDGDFLTECPPGSHQLADYVARLRHVGQLHAPGARFSYCNAGYVVLGRVLEVLSGERWDTALRTELLSPLGIAEISTANGEVGSRPVASGHRADPASDGRLRVQAERWALPQTCAPAGTTLTMGVGDLLRFVHMLMQGGAAPNGTVLLSPRATHAMLDPQIALPCYAAAATTHWGLGPALYRWGDHTLWGHDGDTNGFLSFLRVDPTSGVAVALLTNGGRALDLANEVFQRTFTELAGIAPPAHPAACRETAVHPESYVGRYRRLFRITDVSITADGLALRIAENEAELPTARMLLLTPVDGHVFRYHLPQQEAPSYATFADFDVAGRAGSVFSGYRLSIRERQ